MFSSCENQHHRMARQLMLQHHLEGPGQDAFWNRINAMMDFQSNYINTGMAISMNRLECDLKAIQHTHTSASRSPSKASERTAEMYAERVVTRVHRLEAQERSTASPSTSTQSVASSRPGRTIFGGGPTDLTNPERVVLATDMLSTLSESLQARHRRPWCPCRDGASVVKCRFDDTCPQRAPSSPCRGIFSLAGACGAPQDLWKAVERHLARAWRRRQSGFDYQFGPRLRDQARHGRRQDPHEQQYHIAHLCRFDRERIRLGLLWDLGDERVAPHSYPPEGL